MSDAPSADSLPKSKLESLADHKFVLLLTSISLWGDVVLAVTAHKSLVEVHVEWTKGIPLGLSLVIVITYGLCLNLILPHITIFLNRLWTWFLELLKTVQSSKSHKNGWYPDHNRHVDAFELELEAAYSGNTALVRYAREHIDSVVADFRVKEHYVLIGILLVLEVILDDSATNQLAKTASGSLQTVILIVIFLIGILSLLTGARRESPWVFYLRRPPQ